MNSGLAALLLKLSLLVSRSFPTRAGNAPYMMPIRILRALSELSFAGKQYRFDARMEMSGWNQPGYTGKMPNAEIISSVGVAPLGKLVERPVPLWKDYGLKPYVSVRRSSAGDTLYCRLPLTAK